MNKLFLANLFSLILIFVFANCSGTIVSFFQFENRTEYLISLFQIDSYIFENIEPGKRTQTKNHVTHHNDKNNDDESVLLIIPEKNIDTNFTLDIPVTGVHRFVLVEDDNKSGEFAVLSYIIDELSW